MRKIAALCLILALWGPLLSLPARGEGEEQAVYQELLEAGFPPDWAGALTPTALAHPNWRFEALPVTALSREIGEEYDFSYCLEQEREVPERSLVPASAQGFYEPGPLLDSGLYPASRQAVAFFLDPRNFLCPQGLFQFWDLGDPEQEVESVQAVLADSFLGELVLADGRSLAQALWDWGQERGISPVFLAARLRQEQGRAGNPLAFGAGGKVLTRWLMEGTQTQDGRLIQAPETGLSFGELSALDGYWNFFNLGAKGTGYFQVVKSGLERAKTEGWNSPEAALLGGVAYLSETYLTRYQNTPYLQKWNVDPRSRTPEGGSRNFWGQYMQSILGAYSEGLRLYQLFEGEELLEEAFSFRIPVYEGMPESPCPEPEGGGFSLELPEPYLPSSPEPAKPLPEAGSLPPAESVPFPVGAALLLFFSGAGAVGGATWLFQRRKA